MEDKKPDGTEADNDEAKNPDDSEFFSAKPAISPFNGTKKDK